MENTFEYAERKEPERKNTFHSSNSTDQPSVQAGHDSAPLLSIMATAGGAVGAAFLGGVIAGPMGILGGALVGTVFGVVLQKTHKK